MNNDIAGTFFFNELDPEDAIKGSRDLIGLQHIWSYFTRKLMLWGSGGRPSKSTNTSRGGKSAVGRECTQSEKDRRELP